MDFKNTQNKKIPQILRTKKLKRHHVKFNIYYVIIRVTLEQIFAPNQCIPLLTTIYLNYHMPSTSTIIRVRGKLYTPYQLEVTATLGGKYFEMNSEDLLMGLTTG